MANLAAVSESVRVVLIDSDPDLRALLVERLSKATDIDVVGDAGSVAEALELSSQCRPEVVVVERSLSDGPGIDACKRFRDTGHHVGCVVLAALPDRVGLPATVVDGVVLKELNGDGLERQIRRIGTKQRVTAHS